MLEAAYGSAKERRKNCACIMIVILSFLKKKKAKEIKCLRSLRCSYLVSQIVLCEKKMVFKKKKKHRCAFSAHLLPFCLLIGERKEPPTLCLAFASTENVK